MSKLTVPLRKRAGYFLRGSGKLRENAEKHRLSLSFRVMQKTGTRARGRSKFQRKISFGAKLGTPWTPVLASAPMSIQETALLPLPLQMRLGRWLRRWGTPTLADSLRVEFSPRLKRAFGRCYQAERLIRLTPSLQSSQSSLLEEILCHEAAHAAVYEKHGPEALPHGREWAEMMRVAGFEPRVRIPFVVRPSRGSSANKLVYLHHCPVCDDARQAAKPMHRWRCHTCVDTRTEGRLVILREVPEGMRRQAAASGKKRSRRRNP